MRATPICMLFCATLAMSVAAQASRPQPALQSDFTFTAGQKLFVGDGWLPGEDLHAYRVPQFYALDLTVAWTSDAPAWTRLTRRPNVPDNVITAGTMAPTKDSNTILFFDAFGVFRYNVKTDDWDSSQNATLVNGFHGGATTDTDTGLVYGVSAAVRSEWEGRSRPARVTEFNPATNNYTVQEYDGSPRADKIASTVYSSVAKSLYLYESASDNALFRYDIASRKWSLVVSQQTVLSASVAPTIMIL